MFLQLVLLTFLLILLYLLSRQISKKIYSFILLLFNNHKIAIIILSFLLLPGTLIHELSHFLIATILRVPTGELSLIPKAEEGHIKAGKLMIGASDPFRRTIIGIAPMIIGLAIIYFTGLIFPLRLTTDNRQLITLFPIYILSLTSITMFSSKKDLESLAIAGPIVIIAILALYFTGVRIFLAENLIKTLTVLFTQLNRYLIIAGVVNYIIVLAFSILIHLFQKILSKKIIKVI